MYVCIREVTKQCDTETSQGASWRWQTSYLGLDAVVLSEKALHFWGFSPNNGHFADWTVQNGDIVA